MSHAKPLNERKRDAGWLRPSLRDGSNYLATLGERIRGLRAQRGMTRKMLAMQSGVSERFLAEVEGGTGNPSVLTLRQLASALDVRMESLAVEGAEPSVEFGHTAELLRTLSEAELREAQQWLEEKFGQEEQVERKKRVALVGLRGAGKSTIGGMLAKQLDCPFVELDRVIEKSSGTPMSSIFDLYGQSGFRRLERRCLEEVLTQHRQFVLATGGSLVSEAATYQRLLRSCYTVWLQADPEDHMKRVLAQGDTRPMANNPEAMSDLKRILLEREPLYGKADLVVNTSEKGPGAAVSGIVRELRARA
ncbi:MAG TPA: helix-turn-helix transcriptional regulator [Terriglobales bacterium]|nr:helix-turn-helix transcriptional regulator [Terriglobales bacterium]